jgi:MFS family permease
MIDRSFVSLNWLNFLTADMLTGFGPFIAVYLTSQAWTQGDIGTALSVGTLAAIVAQLPAGTLVDAVPAKRALAALALAAIAGAALMVAISPARIPVMLALAVQNSASTVLTPAIAAITLSLCRHDTLGERLGKNVRFAGIGTGLAALLLGAVGAYVSYRAVFFLAALFGVGAIVALRGIAGADLAQAHTRTSHHAAQPHAVAGRPRPKAHLARDRRLLILGACVALFYLGNAGLLPIVADAVTRAIGQEANLVVAAAIAIPQFLGAMLAPWIGRAAEQWGRRPVLLIGFSALPLRAMLFAIGGPPGLFIVYQALDAISAAMFGVMIPLVVADITHKGGRFNLALTSMNLAASLGAAMSTRVAGMIAQSLGDMASFLTLAAFGLAAVALIWWAMPETSADVPEPIGRPVPAGPHPG